MTRTVRETADQFRRRHWIEPARMWNVWNVTHGHWALTRHLDARAEAEIELPSCRRGSRDVYEVRLVPPGSKDDEGRCP